MLDVIKSLFIGANDAHAIFDEMAPSKRASIWKRRAFIKASARESKERMESARAYYNNNPTSEAGFQAYIAAQIISHLYNCLSRQLSFGRSVDQKKIDLELPAFALKIVPESWSPNGDYWNGVKRKLEENISIRRSLQALYESDHITRMKERSDIWKAKYREQYSEQIANDELLVAEIEKLRNSIRAKNDRYRSGGLTEGDKYRLITMIEADQRNIARLKDGLWKKIPELDIERIR